MSIRDLRNRARSSLHDALSFPAVFVDAEGLNPVECSIRVHDRTQDFGDMAGFDYAPAQRRIEVPQVVALADEVTPVRGGVFSVAPDEAYAVETVNPRDGLTVTVEVTRLSQAEIDQAGLPVPGA